MVIHNNVQSVLKAYVDNKPFKNVKEKLTDAVESGKKDEIILSKQAQSFSQILQKAKGDSAIRQDKVDAIAERVDAGTYRVDARLIAEKMLNSRY